MKFILVCHSSTTQSRLARKWISTVCARLIYSVLFGCVCSCSIVFHLYFEPFSMIIMTHYTHYTATLLLYVRYGPCGSSANVKITLHSNMFNLHLFIFCAFFSLFHFVLRFYYITHVWCRRFFVILDLQTHTRFEHLVRCKCVILSFCDANFRTRYSNGMVEWIEIMIHLHGGRFKCFFSTIVCWRVGTHFHLSSVFSPTRELNEPNEESEWVHGSRDIRSKRAAPY